MIEKTEALAVEANKLPDELVDQILGEARTQEDLFGKDGVLKQLKKRLMERILEAELTEHLGYDKYATEGNGSGNSRNGKGNKVIKTDGGDLEIEVPRDRKSEFEPQIIPKRHRRVSGLDDVVLSLYSRGMTVRDIQEHMKELYGTNISRDLISRITDSILEDITAWRSRPLDPLYPIVFIDGFIAKCRLDGSVSNRAVYVVYGISLTGQKEVLGLYLGETEGAKYWLSVLTELKNRGLNDILIMCADGLKGLPEAVEAAFPKAVFQTCIVHITRNSLKYVPYQDKKAVVTGLQKIYNSDTLVSAESAMDDFELTWGDKYGAIVNLWRNNWTKIIPFFDYPKDIRRVIYTTNIMALFQNLWVAGG